MKHCVDYLSTPAGILEIAADDAAITKIGFVEATNTSRPNVFTTLAKTQLLEYLHGTRQSFSLPLNAAGTDFQRRVWQALTDIPYGSVCSYSDIAQVIGNPKAVRAVGAANGRNPIGIVVPCHRVIGADGSLTGYAGGMQRKAWLLHHEGHEMFRQLEIADAQ